MGAPAGAAPAGSLSRLALASVAALFWASVTAQQSTLERLPEPLTLDYALMLSDASDPQVQLSSADLARSRAERDDALSQYGLKARAVATARWVEPQDFARFLGHDDSRARLFVRKRLYDFGRRDAVEEAVDAEVRSREWLLVDSRHSRRLDIMRRYFEVLLADLGFARENEAMAVAFVTLDRARDRHELGQISDIELGRLESEYQTVRRERVGAEAAQRASRSRLAIALGRPGELSSRLLFPKLEVNERSLPPLEELEQSALESNPRLRALRAELEGARGRVEAARADANPVVLGELEASAYARKTLTRDKFRAGLVFEVPIFTGGRIDAGIARAQADAHRIQALLASHQEEVRQAVLEAWLDLETFYVQREEVDTLSDYRELYLDRSRALYEQEVRTDLGDSMVRTTDARLRAAETEFSIAITWAHVDALRGLEPEVLRRGAEVVK